ncbi:iron uptake porin [Synechococcus sp. M16CYN]|uniref:iron uptake porin n=1 Tax=Synechococcus sp. M16CYN TaxID=3103139 RepID=UPI0033400034
MKLFQQILAAPATLGLLVSGVNAAEININGVSDYAADSSTNSLNQVASVTQFSDVYPTDWAYQALNNLVERYGCVAGYPNGAFRGNRVMTRYEAAALLNSCLDRTTEVTDELRRLLNEFETELAIVRGRADGLEARVGELEATQFSTTTKLRGTTHWVLGAAKYRGKGSQAQTAANGGTSFSYDLRLGLETSFTGKDSLTTRLRSGNMNNIFVGNGVGLFSQEYGFDTDNAVTIDRLLYSFPIGDEFTVVGGPRLRMDDMLAVWPSLYPSDATMDFFTYAGAPGAYNLALGGGAGIYWHTDDGFSISTSYLSSNAELSNPYEGGISTDGSGFSATTQIAYAPESWGIAAAYTKASGINGVGLYNGNATRGAVDLSLSDNRTDSYGLSAWWIPEESGWLPLISAGWGLSDISESNMPGVERATTQSWYVGLEWSDVLLEGNSFGMAVGQPTFVTEIDVEDGTNEKDYLNGGGYAWEFFYKFQVTDNITVTPAIHYLSAPFADTQRDDNKLSAMGGLIKTTFKF